MITGESLKRKMIFYLGLPPNVMSRCREEAIQRVKVDGPSRLRRTEEKSGDGELGTWPEFKACISLARNRGKMRLQGL